MWSIGDSPPAPQLRIDVQPDNWSRSVRAASRLGLRDSEQTYQRFWGMFLPAFHETHPGWSRAAAPPKYDAMRFPSGRSNVLKYIAKFCRRPDGRYGLRAEARIDTRDEVTTKEAYDGLQRRKREIEQAVGQELEWERLEGNRRSRISLYFPDDIRITDEERWPEAQAWLIKAMGKCGPLSIPFSETSKSNPRNPPQERARRSSSVTTKRFRGLSIALAGWSVDSAAVPTIP